MAQLTTGFDAGSNVGNGLAPNNRHVVTEPMMTQSTVAYKLPANT